MPPKPVLLVLPNEMPGCAQGAHIAVGSAGRLPLQGAPKTAGWDHCTLHLAVTTMMQAQCQGHPGTVTLSPESLLLHLSCTCPTTTTEEILLLEQPLGTHGYSGKGPIPRDARSCWHNACKDRRLGPQIPVLTHLQVPS